MFMGSPEFALPTLRALDERYPVVGVVTQPDRPAGRGQVLSPPPVKDYTVQCQLLLYNKEAGKAIASWQCSLIKLEISYTPETSGSGKYAISR